MKDNSERSTSSYLSAEPVANDRVALVFVLVVWVLMLVAALGLVATKGSNVPSWDDWDMIPALTGHQPVTLEWLWSQHNEHRVPIPRLVALGLMRFLAMDFRVGMYFNILATAGLALAMLLTIRRLRGSSGWADALFPLVLLNWGQAANLLWFWQLQFYGSMLLASTTLLLIARASTPPRLWLAVAAGICITSLPLCGANGLGLTPPLALWLGYASLLHWCSGAPKGRRDAIILGCLALGAMLLVGLYFVNYSSVPYHASTHSPRVIARTAAQFLTIGFGPGVVGLRFGNRFPMAFWKLSTLAVLILLLLTGWMLVSRWRKCPAERARTAGLLLMLGAMVSLALGLGMGRDGFETRYITLSAPAICAVYFAWSIYGTPRIQRAARATLFATALLLLVPNTVWGLNYARNLKTHLAAFEADLARGMPPFQLISSHAGYLHPHHLVVLDYLPMLRKAGIGNFLRLRDDPKFREISLPLIPVEMHGMEWENGVARSTGTDGWITFELPHEVQAAAIQLKYTYSNFEGTGPYLAIDWKSSEEAGFSDTSGSKYSATGDRAKWQLGTWSRLGDEFSTAYVAVAGPVRTVRVRLRFKRGTISLHELKVLSPENVGGRD